MQYPFPDLVGALSSRLGAIVVPGFKISPIGQDGLIKCILITFECMRRPEEVATRAHLRNCIDADACHIQLDGLPADADLSAFRMQLERLFVPLKVVFKPARQNDDEAESPEAKESIIPLGEFLGLHSRFSLLAKPGGGKSTLLKRLAVAYCDPGRLHECDDGLPERDWLPLFLRCRELRDLLVSQPI